MWTWIVALAWMYVVSLMTLAEATDPQGSVLGAVITFLFYGLGPLALVMYLLGTPARRKARQAAEARQAAAAEDPAPDSATGVEPDAGSLPAGAPVSPERKEP